MTEDPKRSAAKPVSKAPPPPAGGGTSPAASTNKPNTAAAPAAGAPKAAPRPTDPPPRDPNSAANPSGDPLPNDRYAAFWDRLFDSLALPQWIDEIAAVLLIVFGVVSALSIFNVSSDTTVAAAWSNALTGLFGYGAAIVCAAIFLLGVMLLLPKFGIKVRFPTRRIVALEFGFLAALGLLHVLSADPIEYRSLARLGQGGGQIGWALGTALITLLGPSLAAAALAAILLICVAIILGISRRQIGEWLRGAALGLQAWGSTHAPKRAPVAKPDVAASPSGEAAPSPIANAANLAVASQRVKTFSITRIRPDWRTVPPSLRPASMPSPQLGYERPAPPPYSAAKAVVDTRAASGLTRDESGLPFIPVELPPVPEDERTGLPPPASTHPSPTSLPPITGSFAPVSRRDSNFNAIGTIKTKAPKGGGPSLVERPDGRIKRYFTVAGMKEPKYAVKRDAALPGLNLLRDVEINLPDEQEINQNVVLIENTLLEFDIDVDVVDVKVGPTVTQYAVQPFRENTAAGADSGAPTFSRTRINKIASLSSDLALALSAKRLRLETPVPGHTYIGIEVPNKNPSTVALRSVYESRGFQDQLAKKKSPLFVPLGRDVAGGPVGVDLSQMPHMLIAGTTGSGKSVCIAAIAAALIMDNPPDNVKMVMLDPKMVELSRFNGIPHLLGPVETDQERIIGVLRWCTREMDRRYKVLEEAAARNIDTYNERLGRRRKEQYMPYIVVMIDEIGDLMLTHPDETEKTITRLAQMARAVGMHLIVATQRPSTDVITGLIKANFPSRISFAVASGIDSRVILDTIGAESLLGRGDMLYQSADSPAPRRLQGCYVSDDEVRVLTQHWRDWALQKRATGELPVEAVPPWERGLTRREFLAETDPMLEQAIALVVATGEASASLIQRRLGVGYPRAARIMDLLVELGVVGDFKDGGRSREVLIKPGKDPFKDLIEKRMKGSGG